MSFINRFINAPKKLQNVLHYSYTFIRIRSESQHLKLFIDLKKNYIWAEKHDSKLQPLDRFWALICFLNLRCNDEMFITVVGLSVFNSPKKLSYNKKEKEVRILDTNVSGNKHLDLKYVD